MPPRTYPLEDRLWPKIDTSGDCWEWLASTVAGYGQIRIGKTEDGRTRTGKAYRVVYELLVGPVPPGLELDHLCRNKLCCNPDHLEPVTHAENIRRGQAPAGKSARSTHCKRGHAFTASNTLYYAPRNERICRTCSRLREMQRAPRSRS